MLISFQLSQTINCPVEKTFAFLADFSNMPLWNYYIESVTKISEGPVAMGTVFQQKRSRDLYNLQVTAFKPLQTIMVELQPPGPHLLYGFETLAAGGQTQVTLTWQLDLDNFSALAYLPNGRFKNRLLSFVDWQIQAKTKPATGQNFDKLKTLLETGEVTLQSGRHVSLKV